MELNRAELNYIKFALKENIKRDELFLNDVTNTDYAVQIIKMDMINLSRLLERIEKELNK